MLRKFHAFLMFETSSCGGHEFRLWPASETQPEQPKACLAASPLRARFVDRRAKHHRKAERPKVLRMVDTE